MAFKNNPTEDTDSSQRLYLSREINARDGGASGRDEDLFNVFVEPVKNKITRDDRHFIVKRSGTINFLNDGPTEAVRGMFFWEDQTKLYYVINNDVYTYNTVSGATGVISNVFGTTSGDVGFCLFQYSTGVSKIVVTDGTTLSTIDSAGTVVVNVDVDLPVHLPYPIYLDGYIFVAKIGTAEMYNSNNDDPLAWTSGDFIVAEMEGDNIVRLAKINNYIVAFGTNSIEYFWDAAIATGSPLQRNDSPIKLNTYLAGLAQFGNQLFYIGVNEGGQPDVYTLKDFKIEEIGSPTVSRYLNTVSTNTTTWRGGIVSLKGHTFYVLNAGTTKTYVYDVDTKLWSRWGFQNESIFNLNSSTSVSSASTSYTVFCLGSTNSLYKFSDTTYQDNNTTFSCVITTEASDFGTLNRKTMRKATVIGDRPTASNNITVQWSDDDGSTFNTGLTTNLNQSMPCVYRLGSFRQRVFKLSYSANTDFRIQALEVEINKGRS